jgi:hypothetical protein
MVWCVVIPTAQSGGDVMREWWGVVVEWVVVLVRVVIGDESSEVVTVVDVKDRDGVV